MNYPPGMSNEDLEYFDSPDPEFNECVDCGEYISLDKTRCVICSEIAAALDGEEE